MSLLDTIREAFDSAQPPRDVVNRRHPGTTEYADADLFLGKDWREIELPFIEQHYDAYFVFTPEAFCYYLPAALSAPVVAQNPACLTADVIVNMLNWSSDANTWDAMFVARWPRLTSRQCDAVRDWIVWLSDAGGRYFDAALLDRAFDLISTLSSRAKADNR